VQFRHLSRRGATTVDLVHGVRARGGARRDRGQMLPGGIDGGWEVTPETMAP
jgi:hypothetical protein